MIFKHLLEDLARLSGIHLYAETNIEGVHSECGNVYLEAGSKDEDIDKIDELNGEIRELEDEIKELKEKLETDEGLNRYKKELKEEQEKIIHLNSLKVKRWEEFARECYNSLTPKWKTKMEWRVREMNKFIAEENKETEKYQQFV